MKDNTFFKPTALYKEFMILDLIEKNKNITQREIAEEIGVAVSLVNNYLDDYESKGLIRRKRYSTKTIEYFCTKKGIEKKKLLNINYLKASQVLYNSAKDNIITFIYQITRKGFKKILLYGAGEVAEIILDVIRNDKSIPLEVLAVVDDDLNKQNKDIVNKKIISMKEINDYVHDGILISSYTHHLNINDQLIDSHYESSKIIHFFNT